MVLKLLVTDVVSVDVLVDGSGAGGVSPSCSRAKSCGAACAG